MPEPPPDTFFICPVCWWEDDGVQFDDVNYKGGANRQSLRQAQDSFARFGVSMRDKAHLVRPPLRHERP